MKQLKFKFVALSSALYVSQVVPKANNMIANPQQFDDETCYNFAKKIIRHMTRRAMTRTVCIGEENLPKEGGYIMYSNHQGKYDALGILLKHKRPCSVLWEEKSADRILARQVCGLIKGKVISFTDFRAQIKCLNELADEVKNGRPFLIFPEGGYKDNKNNLQEFKHGCFTCSIKSQTPIVPVCIYDSWKSMDTNLILPARTQVHFLKPIMPEEYAGLKKPEISDLVKSRIETRLNEIKEGKYKGKNLRKLIKQNKK